MNHDQIEAEIKEANLRKWQAEQDAAKREHELKMAKATRKGVDHFDVAMYCLLTALLTITPAGIVANNVYKADTEIAESRLEQCRERLHFYESSEARE